MQIASAKALAPFVDPETGVALERASDSLLGGQRPYPIVGGIPRFVQSQAYTASFGVEWNIHVKTQLDSHTGAHLSRERLERCLGRPVGEFRGQMVLEAGCGAGRFTELLVGAGAIVHSIDMSVAVEANRGNVGDMPNHVVAQADLMKPPFADESFDVVLCLGVLQHTPSTQDSLRALWRSVKPGGMLVIDHYTWSLSRVTQLDPVYRAFLKRLPPEISKKITDLLTRVYFPVHWAVRDHRILQALLSRISPLYTYMHAHPNLARNHHYEWARLDAFDHLTDRHKRLLMQRHVRQLMESLHPADLKVWKGGNGIEARAFKV